MTLTVDALAERLEAILRQAPLRLQALEIVRSLDLPDWAIGAGFIRAAVWDELSGFTTASAVDDIDVLYFDARDCGTGREAEIESRLREIEPTLPWSVRNQARMHIRNGDEPYISTADALRFWLETPTCVAVRIDADGQFEIMAPYGLDDLFAMAIRPTPRGRVRNGEYAARIAKKKWHERWPNVTIELP
ncbi:MAG: nucleotidyltransferase family protein [Pseudomonadota bacterium]